METARLPIRACIRYGWETFKKRPWFLIGITTLILAINFALPVADEDSPLTVAIAFSLISFIVGIFLQIGSTNLLLRAHDGIETVHVRDLWYPHHILKYIGASILVFVCVILGLVLLIIPGVIAAIALSYTSYIVVDKGTGSVDAIKESWRITKGNRWRLLLLGLVMVLVNLLGLLALVVGLLVTIPVSMIASAHAYRFLEQARGREAVAVEDDAPTEPEVVEAVPAGVPAAA
jgi:hypothetical protein